MARVAEKQSKAQSQFVYRTNGETGFRVGQPRLNSEPGEDL